MIKRKQLNFNKKLHIFEDIYNSNFIIKNKSYEKKKIEDLENNILQNDNILKELQHGTDRSKAIVGATIIETQLEKLLSIHLVGNSKLKKKALEYNGFLGTFSAKINACFLLGLISKNLYNDIERIRAIRNTFAHNLIDCDFNSSDIKSEVHKLKLLSDAFSSNWEKQNVSMMFLMEVSLIYVALIKKIVRSKPINELPNEINDLGFEDIDYDYLNNNESTTAVCNNSGGLELKQKN